MQHDFELEYGRLNATQKQAVDTIDGPVLVIAGPGTGKTHILSLRAANILRKTDVAPQNILCLTYTEVGARNMRKRLTSIIGQAAYDIRISTYHGFGSEIIRSHGEYFTEYGDQQPVDALGQDSILRDIYDALPASNPLWKPDTYLRDALDFINEAKNALLSPDDIRTIAQNNRDYIDHASKHTQHILASLGRMDKKALPLFQSLQDALSVYVTDDTLPQKIQPLANIAFNQLHTAITHALASNKTTELTIWKNKWLIKNRHNEWIFAGERECDKLLGAADIYEQYERSLTHEKLFDYSDMITRAIAALEKHDELRFSLQEQYLYIMLDEFQDTNISQLRLVELLSNNPNDHGRPNVMAVGDDDQAIFSFQGADVTNMLRFSHMYTDVTTIALTDNYRSHAAILQTADSIASQISERLQDAITTGPKQLKAKNKTIDTATIIRTQYMSDVAQYDAIATQIDELITSGVQPDQIAVIAPQHKYLEPLIPYLQSKSIPIRYDKRENVLDDPHILAITLMAELVEALHTQNFALADSLWPAVLSADYWQLPTSEIWEISWAAYQNRYNKDGTQHWTPLLLQNKTLRPIALFFVALAAKSETTILELMLDYLTGIAPVPIHDKTVHEYSCPYYEYYFGDTAQNQNSIDFTTALSNLTVLRQHLREYRRSSEAPLILHDLLQFIADHRAANAKLLNTSPYHSAANAVQVLTAYGAKGLEFAVVFVVATQNDVWGMSARGKSSNITLPQNLQIIRQAGTTKDEKLRLFYVAITRAKHTLYITSFKQNYAGKSSLPLEFMNEQDGIAHVLPAQYQTVLQNDHEAVEKSSLQHYWSARHVQDSASQPALKDLLLPKLESFQLTVTHVNAYTNVVFAGPESFFVTSILRFPKAPSVAGQYGSAIHETLEQVQYSLITKRALPSIQQVHAIYADKLRAKRLGTHDFERQLVVGNEALQSFMEQWGHNFVAQARSEVDFAHEGSFIDTVHLSGKIDQMLVDTDAKAIKVIDFKTGKSHSKWENNKVNMYKYRQQLLFYKLLVEHSHTYKSFSVEEGSLVFVEPDTAGSINELVLTYTDEDIERTKKLIRAVWNRIMRLDFPDISDYSKDVNGIRAFEDWLIANDN